MLTSSTVIFCSFIILSLLMITHADGLDVLDDLDGAIDLDAM